MSGITHSYIQLTTTSSNSSEHFASRLVPSPGLKVHFSSAIDSWFLWDSLLWKYQRLTHHTLLTPVKINSFQSEVEMRKKCTKISTCLSGLLQIQIKANH